MQLELQVVRVMLKLLRVNCHMPRSAVLFSTIGITGEYILTIEGKCSFDSVGERKVDMTCKIGADEFKKHS